MKENRKNTDCRFKEVTYFYLGTTTKAVLFTYPFNKKFYGIAKTAPEDTYDREIGEKIALARALDKMSDYNYRIYSEQLKENDAAYVRERAKINKRIQKNYKNNIRKADTLYEEATRRINAGTADTTDTGGDK